MSKKEKKKFKNPFKDQGVQFSFKLKLTSLILLILSTSIYLLIRYGVGN